MPGTVFQYWSVTFPVDGLQDAVLLELVVAGEEQAARARDATIAVVAASPRTRALFPLMLKRSLSEVHPGSFASGAVTIDNVISEFLRTSSWLAFETK
jgi:hypothetical protein